MAVVPHCSTVRHPEGYTDNKEAVKFIRFQWFMLTFANSSHMAIRASKGSQERFPSTHFEIHSESKDGTEAMKS